MKASSRYQTYRSYDINFQDLHNCYSFLGTCYGIEQLKNKTNDERLIELCGEKDINITIFESFKVLFWYILKNKILNI